MCSVLDEVILVMPSLVRVRVLASKVRMLQVIASDTVTLMCSSFGSIKTKIKVTREEMVNFYRFENWGALEECEGGR